MRGTETLMGNENEQFRFIDSYSEGVRHEEQVYAVDKDMGLHIFNIERGTWETVRYKPKK